MLTENEVIPLDMCEHVFHAECLSRHVTAYVNDSKFPIRCPAEGCKELIDQLDIQDLLEPPLYQKFVQF
jgi:hypothetical protein